MTRLPILACTFVVLGCSDQTVLLQSGAVTLRYTCGTTESQLRSAVAAPLLREYAVLAVRDAIFQQRDTAARAVTAAYETNDLPALEREVVRYACTYGDVRSAAAPRFPERGSKAPAFSLREPAPSSRVITHLSEQGHVVVLAFWATWCKPCREEFSELRQLHAEYRDRGVQVYLVLHQDDPEAAIAWMRRHGGELPLLLDPGVTVAERFKLRGIPATFVFDRNGILAAYLLSSGNQLERHILPLLNRPAA